MAITPLLTEWHISRSYRIDLSEKGVTWTRVIIVWFEDERPPAPDLRERPLLTEMTSECPPLTEMTSVSRQLRNLPKFLPTNKTTELMCKRKVLNGTNVYLNIHSTQNNNEIFAEAQERTLDLRHMNDELQHLWEED
ncbi:hypothetical protein LSAT2_012045 [Lamellibrachia satsuma]|nr:hypothetical protein LSAT2_012045 [Lamellibrachia satsuma]